MEANRIRIAGFIFYLLIVQIIVVAGFAGVLGLNVASMEVRLYDLVIANGNIFFAIVVVIFYIGFVLYFELMAVVYHEVGHAVAMRHYGMERIMIKVRGLFTGICISCKGKAGEDIEDYSEVMDASGDFAGGVLSGAMLLIIYALTQSLAILVIFVLFIQYSAFETLEGNDYNDGASDNILTSRGFFLMNELSEEDIFAIEEEMYLENPT